MNADISIDGYNVIGFDLDDTLHSFKEASASGSEAIFDYLAEEFGRPKPKLRADYAKILAESQGSHFVEPVSSQVYRSRRFQKLLEANAILPHRHLDELLAIYESSFSSHLSEKTGAKDLLEVAKRAGKTVVVVTEGPQDAQERTLAGLGVTGLVDFLVTSSSAGRSKLNGLFDVALAVVGCNPSDMLYIGDNYERDCLPCLQAGIKAVLFDEHGRHPTVTDRIDSLEDLKTVFRQPVFG